jgi:ubiquinone/menaquinone biosynthesis C-methylase UbiE
LQREGRRFEPGWLHCPVAERREKIRAVTDWGTGQYELTAERLEPAADVAVEALGLEPGQRVIDVGCGTGNAAIVAARRGASAVGIDLSERLVDVARRRAEADGLDAEFAVGDALALPADDDSFDAAVSVFGVIFADAEAAARELLRVVKPGGRIAVTTWTTEGPTPRVMDVIRDAFGAPPSPPRWSDPEVLRSLFAPHEVRIAVHDLAFTAESAHAYLREHLDHHPMWLAVAPELEKRGKLEDVIETATAIFESANEDPEAFRTTSRYHLATVDVG